MPDVRYLTGRKAEDAMFSLETTTTKVEPMRSILITLLVSGLAGCATYGPTWSEISGNRYNRAVLNRQPALIEKVDGWSSYPQYPIKLDPGPHEVVLQGATRWPGGAPLRTMTLTLEPCKRYYL